MMSYFSRPFNLDRMVRLCLAIGACLLVFLLLGYLAPVLTPFFVAWLLAFMLGPSVRFVQRYVKSRTLATLIVMATILVLITLFFFVMIPNFINEFSRVKELLLSRGDTFASLIPEPLMAVLQSYHSEYTADGQLLKLNDMVSLLHKVFPRLVELLMGSVNVIGKVVSAVFALIYLFFILHDQDAINKGIVRLVPRRRKAFFKAVLRDLNSSMSVYFRRQAFVAFLDGVMFVTGFYIIGMPMGVVMGVTLGLCNMVPYLQYLGLPPAALLMVLNATETGNSVGMAVASLLLVFVLVQVVQDFFLIPKIMGDSMGLNPVVVLLSLSVWGYLLGVLGLIIALPLTSILHTYLLYPLCAERGT